MTGYELPRYRVQLVREGTASQAAPRAIENPIDAFRALRSYFEGLDREHMVALMLDAKNRPIGMTVVSIGILDGAPVHPRETYKAAMLLNAAAIILAHNHPSGDPEPSPADIRVTHRIQRAGELLGIDLLDHIVIGDNGRYVSIKQEGRML